MDPLLTNEGARPAVGRRWSTLVMVAVTAVGLAGAATSVAFYLTDSQRREQPSSPSSPCAAAQLTLVQSTPVGDFDVAPIATSLPTHEAFVRLADAASASLDLTAMYCDLLGTEDRETYNSAEMQRFGAERGVAVFAALERAAQRGVAVRLLLGTLNDPMNSTEVRTLLTYPSVAARTWDPERWYGGGIMHLKLWHSDSLAAYIGSANADWKSLAQVKELGLLLNGSAATVDLGRVFEVFWQWAAPGVPASSRTYFSERYQAALRLPPWDVHVPVDERDTAAAPFALGTGAPLAAISSAATPQALCGDAADAGLPPSTAFVSASPGGALSAGRTFDEQALVDTIRSAEHNLSLSVMDFLPASEYEGGHGGRPVHWPALADALLAVAYAKPVRVRVLVSRWAHTSALIAPAMRQLADGLAACASGYQSCAGSLEIRFFEVPGWQNTTLPNSTWPPFTRVNHAKFIVSDKRVNIGTSNWMWGYMFQTAGASYNTNASELVAAAQLIFDRDWESSYAKAL